MLPKPTCAFTRTAKVGARIGDPDHPRFLLIGDSILNGYLKTIIAVLEGKAYLDAWVIPYHQSEHVKKLHAERSSQTARMMLCNSTWGPMDADQTGHIRAADQSLPESDPRKIALNQNHPGEDHSTFSNSSSIFTSCRRELSL